MNQIDKNIDLSKIELLVLDVDGVLTDGKIIINDDGSESKGFNSHDGHAIRLWRRAGLKVAFLSGRCCEATANRAKQLDIEFCFQDSHVKIETMHELIKQTSLKPENIAYIGDDLMDIPPMRFVAFGAAVANAVSDVKARADYVTNAAGGNGAVREVIELILRRTGRWAPLMLRYME